MKKWTGIVIILIFLGNYGFAQAQQPLLTAKIEVEQKEDVLSFIPVVQNNGSVYLSYDYLLLVKKTGAQKNLSINQQKGKFTLDPGEVKTLSLLQLNKTEGQRLKAILYIRDEEENQLITKDSVEIRPQQEATQVEERSLMNISGMVVDASKTKIGRDFYDLFYSVYNQYPNKYDFIVTIDELPFRGLTSKIQIKVDQNTVYEFLGNPDEDYIKQQVSMSLNRLAQYAQQNPSIQSY